MSQLKPTKRLTFDNAEKLESQIDKCVKRRYGRGVFVDQVAEAPNDTYIIQLGNIVPRDVSDCRQLDRVLKFISYKPIQDIVAEPNNGNYIIELPDRSEIIEGYRDRRENLAMRLDTSIAQVIYEDIVQFSPVKTQLSAITKILWVAREKQPEPVEEIIDMRGRDKIEQTERYLRVLEDTDFIKITEENDVIAGPNLNAHDDLNIQSDEFTRLVLGQIVNRAFHTLRDELNLTLLDHYPKFAGSYYFSALQRNEPTLELHAEAVTSNLRMIYNDQSTHKHEVEMKLLDLAKVGVLEEDGGYFKSNRDVYNELSARQPVTV